MVLVSIAQSLEVEVLHQFGISKSGTSNSMRPARLMSLSLLTME